ncbi:MAG: hypothetical protein ACM3SV_14550 [Betaproteobacteria bacterium]
MLPDVLAGNVPPVWRRCSNGFSVRPESGWRLLIALLALAAVSTLAIFHPLAPISALIAVLACSALVFIVPSVWLFAVPALLPVMNFSPWSGWFAFEEFDLLLLATIAGGWARWGFDGKTENPENAFLDRWRMSRWILLGLLVWNLIALLRGLADAGIGFDWFGSYENAMNSVRLAKPLFLMALLFPLLRRELLRNPVRSHNLYIAGMACGLAIEVLAVVWERLVYVGLLDFSSRYRATGLFWEMHVGGAAIDAYLVLCLPFALWMLLQAPTFMRWLMAATLALLAGYVCLATFSRSVYLAVLIEIVMILGFAISRRYSPESRVNGAIALRWLIGAATIFAINVMSLAYFGYGALLSFFAITLACIFWARPMICWAGLKNWRSQGIAVVAAVFLLEIVAVGGGGTFMLGRLSTSEHDMGGRFDHWKNAAGLLDSSGKWLMGLGMGRSPAHRASEVAGEEFPGNFAVLAEKENHFARITGPKDVRLAGLFGLSQRLSIDRSSGLRVDADLRFSGDVDLYLKVCEKHLLYEIRCVSSVVQEKSNGPRWQHVSIPLEGRFEGKGSAYPRLSFFTISVLGAAQAVDVDNLRLIDSEGRSLITNGDFTQNGARWFMTGTSYFLPWHVDNLWLEAVLEQGLVGLAFLGAALALSAFPRRGDLLGAYLATAVTGFLIIGAFGSALDVPRIAFCLYLLSAF